MRRLSRLLLIALLVPILLLAAVLLGANTETGRGLIVRELERATGGQVVLSGLTGALPGSPRIARLELRDQDGVWLAVEQAALDLDALQLLWGKVAIEALSARSAVLARLPAGAGQGGGAGAPIRLPVRVLFQRFAIDDLSIDGVLPGAPRLAIEGSGSATGALDLQTALLVTALGRTDRYRLDAGVADGRYRLSLAIDEAREGLLAALAAAAGLRLPAELGAWRLDAALGGTAAALSLHALLDAGPLQAAAQGLLDLDSGSASQLRLVARVPAMALAAGGTPGGAPADATAIAWRQIDLQADLHGPLTAPQGSARLAVQGLAAGTVGLDRLSLSAVGDPARLVLDGELEGLHAPLALPATARTVPLRLAGELTLKNPARPFVVAVRHPLLELAATGGLTARAGRVALSLPDLAPLGALAGADLAGSARLSLQGAADGPRVDGNAELALTRAPGPLVALLGPTARLAVAAKGEGAAWRLSEARLDGARVRASAQGRAGSDALDLGWTLDLTDLGALGPGWSGRAQASGGLSGRPAAPDLVADLKVDAGLPGAGRGRVAGRLRARLAEPGGSLDLKGAWAGQPVAIGMRAGRTADGTLELALGDSRWAGVVASGGLRLPPGASLPRGEVRLRADRLADLAPLVGPGLAGGLRARLTLTDAGAVEVEAQGDGLVLPGSVRIGTLALGGGATDPLGAARIQATLRLGRLAVGPAGVQSGGQTTGDLALAVSGPLAALDLGLDLGLAATPVGPASLKAGARLDAPARRLTLQRLEAQGGGETLRLLAPATLDLSAGLTLDRLRLGLRQGSLELAGRLAPALDFTATVVALPLDLVRLARPDLPLTGTLAAQVRLAGTLDALTGSIGAQATGLRLTAGAGRTVPPASVRIAATLAADGTGIDARAETGPRASLHLHGRIGGRLPLAPGPLALRAEGRLDLALLDPLLSAGGRQVSGRAVLATAIGGTLAAPRLGGTLTIADATVHDRTIGLSLTEIAGTLALAGDTVRVQRLTASAGRGTIAVEGSVGVFAPGLPVDLRLAARKARPVQLDLLDAQADADLRLAGRLAERLEASGTVRLLRVDVRLPDRLPAQIAVLEVREQGQRRAGSPTPRPPTRPLDLGLDLTVSAPRSIFIRGRGVDAELGGELRLRGSAAAPIVAGGFNLLRGDYKLVGQTLRFTRGRLGFDGAALDNPTIDLEARVTAAGSTAILAVLGTARAPRIELKGEPPLPQDEVLSRLLFGVAGGRLSTLQAARLGLAAASLAGIGGGDGGGLGVLERARTGLGLDRLSVGTDERGETTIEGGRQVSERVYLGARQGTRAGETQGVLRIELTPAVKLEADVGSSGGTRAGVAYEREY